MRQRTSAVTICHLHCVSSYLVCCEEGDANGPIESMPAAPIAAMGSMYSPASSARNLSTVLALTLSMEFDKESGMRGTKSKNVIRYKYRTSTVDYVVATQQSCDPIWGVACHGFMLYRSMHSVVKKPATLS